MADLLLWRRLTDTDFRAINGEAAPSGTGGGARHIALGTASSTKIPISDFLSSRDDMVVIPTEPWPPSIPKGRLTFHGNPNRRGGEWRINDQHDHRHPAWTRAAGFPAKYDSRNRPIVFVIRVDGKYHARLSLENDLRRDAPSLFGLVSANQTKNTGIVTFSPSWASALSIPDYADVLGEYEKLAEEAPANAFDPTDVEDGRRKILAEVVRRQGQRKFRRKLLDAYGKCAITGTAIEVTLEAAHITPYRGASTNHVSNGILLRGDVHTLFDLGLITIDSDSYRVQVSAALSGSDYMSFHNKKIALPKDGGSHPSSAALKEHMKIFRA